MTHRRALLALSVAAGLVASSGAAAVLAGGSSAAGTATDGADPASHHRTLPEPLPELPVLHGETVTGAGVTTEDTPVVAPLAKVVDGEIDDWVGDATGFGGSVVHSAGELIYSDFVFDAYGADDGGDAERLALLDPLAEAVPETYRLDPVFQADVAGQLGFPTPEFLKAEEHYGDAGYVEQADLLELRVAADADTVWVLARTTTMRAATDGALLLLADTRDDTGEHAVPFNAGVTTDRADVAVLLAHGAGRAIDLVTGETVPVEVAVNPAGYTNAIEAAIPRALLQRGGEPATSGGDPAPKPGPPNGTGPPSGPPAGPGGPGGPPPHVPGPPDRPGGPSTPTDPGGELVLTAATGRFDPATGGFADLANVESNLANVAFRFDEPARTWMDKRQALALHAGSIDEFTHTIDLAALASGRTESWRPGPGYHERIFRSSETISSEGGLEGVHQHYGLYVPSSYEHGSPTPLTYWLHWRGGKAHSAAALSPRILRDFGEEPGSIVVSPRGRGTSTWYLGRGHVDVNEVWDDVRSILTVDEDRVYVSGHSMGGYGSYLLSVLYPDRFAAALPVAAPVTQGAWTGADFDGCDELRMDEYTPCYVETNNGDARVQHTRRLLANLRNTPIGIFQASADELVPTSGVTRQVEELVRLGYRHRYYLFLGYEHYSHPVVDEWAEGVRYLHSHVRNPNPERVTYIRDLPFERRVEEGPSVNPAQSHGQSFNFDRAYWMSELTPVDAVAGVARFDGRSLALAGPPPLTAPEAGGPASLGQVGPYTMTGLAWLADPLTAAPAVSNAFEATLDGASAVRLDLPRMSIETSRTITAAVTTEAALELRLAGPWTTAPAVTVDGVAVVATITDGALVVHLPAGASTLTIG